MKLAVLAFLSLASCASLTFHPTGFNESELAEIHKAADAWNNVTLPDKKIRFDGNYWEIVHENPPSGYAGYTTHRPHRIQIRPDVGVYSVALHEFGHALGLQHITSPGVMTPQFTVPNFTKADLAECKRVGACP